jgi:hypothetical protein
MGLSIDLDSAKASRDLFETAFREYADWYTDKHQDANAISIFKSRAQKLAYDLYAETAAIAPTDDQIEAAVHAQGWKIPKWFHDPDAPKGFRIGRGPVSFWLEAAVKSLPKRRGRKSKARKAQEAEIRGMMPTLDQMQAFVIAWRERARLYLASGWLPAIQDLGKHKLNPGAGRVDMGAAQGPSPEFQGTFARNRSEMRGGAEVTEGQGTVRIRIWNRTPGMVEQDEKHHIVEKALLTQAMDMAAYILPRFFRK